LSHRGTFAFERSVSSSVDLDLRTRLRLWLQSAYLCGCLGGADIARHGDLLQLRRLCASRLARYARWMGLRRLLQNLVGAFARRSPSGQSYFDPPDYVVVLLISHILELPRDLGVRDGAALLKTEPREDILGRQPARYYHQVWQMPEFQEGTAPPLRGLSSAAPMCECSCLSKRRINALPIGRGRFTRRRNGRLACAYWKPLLNRASRHR
jgi:hypothetical protein